MEPDFVDAKGWQTRHRFCCSLVGPYHMTVGIVHCSLASVLPQFLKFGVSFFKFLVCLFFTLVQKEVLRAAHR